MDGRISDGLNRFIKGEMELFGNPCDAVDSPELKGLITSNLAFQFCTFCVYLAVNKYNIPVYSYRDAVTEGYSERGFDGLVISLGDEPLASPEDAARIARENIAQFRQAGEEGQPEEKPMVKILMIQVKMASAAELKEIDNLAMSALRFLGEADFLSEWKPNQQVGHWWRIYSAIRQVYQEENIPLEPELDVLFIYQGIKQDQLNEKAAESCARILRRQFNASQISTAIWRIDEIVDAIALADQAVDGVLTGARLLPLPETKASGYIGYAPALSIARLIPKIHQFGGQSRPDERVFSDNVRSFKGNGLNNPGAEGLRHSLHSHEGDQVILRHNGITIVARKVSLRPSADGTADVELKAFQIVNGAQSSFVLQRNEDKLANAHIPIKIVETEDEAVKEGVILGANTQSQVTAYDMLAVMPEVRALQQGFNAIGCQRPDKLWLRRRLGERFPDHVTHRFHIVTPRQLLEAFVSAYWGRPHYAHSDSSQLIDHVPGEIFSREHSTSVYRALGWLLAAGRHWADKNGFIWSDESNTERDAKLLKEGERKIYGARHQFVFALWQLCDPNPDSVNERSQNPFGRRDNVEKRFEAVCSMLSSPESSPVLTQKAAAAIDAVTAPASMLSMQVRKKAFTDAVRRAVARIK